MNAILLNKSTGEVFTRHCSHVRHGDGIIMLFYSHNLNEIPTTFKGSDYRLMGTTY